MLGRVPVSRMGIGIGSIFRPPPDNGQIHRMQFPDGASWVPTSRPSRAMWRRNRDYSDATGHVVIVGPNNTFIGVGSPPYDGAPEKIESGPKRT